MKKSFLIFLLILIIPILFFLIAFKTLGDYGINWDEPFHFRRGQAFLQYFLTGQKNYNNIPRYKALKGTSDSSNFRDSEKHFQEVNNNPNLADSKFQRSYYQDEDWNGEYHIDIDNTYGHPALNGVLAAFFNKVFYQKLGILDDLESYHLFEITVASLLVFTIAIFMWKEFGIIQSIVSSLVLTTYPLFVGEQHFNIKDPIITCFYSLTLICFYIFIKKQKYFWGILTILFFAIGLSTKFNIIFIVVPLFIWLFFYFYKNNNFPVFIKKFWPLLIISPIIILLVLVGSFPTLWKDPILGIKRIVDFYLEVGYSAPSQPQNYYLFKIFNTYPITWIFYTTPIPTIIIFIFSLFFVKSLSKSKSFSLLLILSLITIVGRISFFGALSYGGVRLIMEFIPILAMLCGITAGLVYKKINKLNIYIFILIIIVIFIPVIIKLVNIHPNENVFFNKIVGGLAGAKEKNINSWGNSNGNAYYPAISWLNQHAEQNAFLTIPVGSISNIPRFKLRPDISLSPNYWSGPEHKGEYVLELTYDYSPMLWYNLNYLNTVMNPLFEVKVDGVAIAKVWKNDKKYVKEMFKNQKELIIPVNTQKDKKNITITLPKTEKIMKTSFIVPTKNCSSVQTGYVRTSTNNSDWIRENEDIAQNQLKHAELKTLTSNFDFYFVAREAKVIVFEVENDDTCLIKSKSAIVTILE